MWRVLVLGFAVVLSGCTSSTGLYTASFHLNPYRTAVKAGNIYRTAEPTKKFRFGENIIPLCDENTSALRKSQPENFVIGTDNLGQQERAVGFTASGSATVLTGSSLSVGAGAGFTKQERYRYSTVREERLSDTQVVNIKRAILENSARPACRKLIRDYQRRGHLVFVAERTYRADEAQRITLRRISGRLTATSSYGPQVGGQVDAAWQTSNRSRHKNSVVEVGPKSF